MAQRRMFSPKIVGSDAFLEMPTSTRELYFQFGMYADDDGFISPRKIMRMVGASDDDLKMLIAKRFVIPFEDGVVVIKHWQINNLVRKDWYQPTQYVEDKKMLAIKGNGAYTLDFGQGKPLVLAENGEFVNNPLTEVRLGKVILGKDRLLDSNKKSLQEQIEPYKTKYDQNLLNEFSNYWTEKNSKGKERWELEKFFEVGKRLATWAKNENEWGKNKAKGILDLNNI